MIISNKAKCRKCSDALESTTQYDVVTCSCGTISIAGGKGYLPKKPE